MEAEGTSLQDRRQRRRRHHRRAAARASSTRWCSPAAPPHARDLPIPGRELDGIHQAMEFLPWANRVQLGDECSTTTASRRSPRRARRSSSSAAATPARTAWAPRTVRAQRACTSSRSCRARRRRAPSSTPWPTYPLMYRVSSAHEEGGERVFSVNTEQFVGDDGKVTGAQGARGRDEVDGRFEKVEGSDFELEADLVLLAMGFVGPEKPGLLTDLGVELDRARQRRPRRRTGPPTSPACSSPVTWAAVSR